MRKILVTEIFVLSCAMSALSVGPAIAAVQASPGPIPGAGFLSYVALGLLGVGSAGWKRWRRGRKK
jgi:hypothetical protein